jgi:hypothetical protein
MIPLYGPTLWQPYPASTRDLMDFLLGLDLTDEEFKIGCAYLEGQEICRIDGCDRPRFYRDTCRRHYDRMRRYGEVEAPPKVAKACKTDACETKAICRGLCKSCYNRAYDAARKAKQRGVC